MTSQTNIPPLNSLEFIPYLDENGAISEDLQGKIGVYAIFDRDRILKFVGYSRDIHSSLKQHLVRQPQNCYWLKIETIDRPSRTFLEEIRQKWIAENGAIPAGNDTEENAWIQPIDTKIAMTEAEIQQYQNSEELGKIKLLKSIARRVEAEVQTQLKDRGVQMEIRFNPKLKEQGLLDLK